MNPATAEPAPPRVCRTQIRRLDDPDSLQIPASPGPAIQLARLWGIKTVNVVRRPGVVDELYSLGGDVVLVDGDDLAGRVSSCDGQDAPIRFGIDSVGGPRDEPDRIVPWVRCGTLVIYGAMSGELAAIAPGTIVFNDLPPAACGCPSISQTASRDKIRIFFIATWMAFR